VYPLEKVTHLLLNFADPNYAVDTKVQAQVRQGSQWLKRWDNCVVTYRHDDGTYEVDYADGDSGENIPAYRIRPPPKGSSCFMPEDKIRAIRKATAGSSKATNQMHDAVVVRQQPDGRYVVCFDDGMGNGSCVTGEGQVNTPPESMQLVSSRYYLIE
jgi:hypothetical protein